MPIIMTEKPTTIVPTDLFFSPLANIRNTTPPIARKGVTEDGFRNSSQAEPPSEFKLSSHAVAVVPRLAPIMTPTDCMTVMILELTRPTTITVVTDDCTNTDKIVPKAHPAKRFAVILSMRPLSLPPASCVNVSLITFMPNMNSASPLSSPVINSNICLPLIFSLLYKSPQSRLLRPLLSQTHSFLRNFQTCTS